MAVLLGDQMGSGWGLVRAAVAFTVTLAIMGAVTALLWYGKILGIEPHHPVFFYLLPVALIAIAFGSAPAIASALMATACAAYFLYDPMYSFHVANRLEYGDLVCFAALALISVKCTVELMRPVRSFQQPSRASRGRPIA